MIVGNRLKFGYGDIAVGTNVFSCLTFKNFKPPEKVGTTLTPDLIKNNEIKFESEEVRITLDYIEARILQEKLKELQEDESLREFAYKGYLFDFSKYNTESIRVVEKHLQTLIFSYISLLAC